MNLSQQFGVLTNEWMAHCQKNAASSNIEDLLNHPSFRGLIALGLPAVPLIMQRYTSDEQCPWEFVLEEITGVKFIKNRNEIMWDDVTRRRLAWWNDQA